MNNDGNGADNGEARTKVGGQTREAGVQATAAGVQEREAGSTNGRGDDGPAPTGDSAFAEASALATGTGDEPGGQVEASIFPWEHGVKVEPWPEAVEGGALLDELTALTKRYVILPKHAAETLALWTLHTYAFQWRDVTTYIGVESPEKRCGKTTLLTVMSELVNRPVVASNISSPAFLQVIEGKQPTLLIDEADTVLHRNDELGGILNSGSAGLERPRGGHLGAAPGAGGTGGG